MTIAEIYQQMRDCFVQETGLELHETGETAVRLYTLASQVYGLYVQNEWTLKQCFPQTAQGMYLDHHASLRGLARNKATQAAGQLRFSVDEARGEPLVIAAGATCLTAALVAFETTQNATIAAGALFVDVPARAVLAGADGNVAAGAIRSMSMAPVGVSSCRNLNAFVGGADDEQDEALRLRVLDSYQRMPNGANAAYYEQEALKVPQVAAVNVLGRNRGNGTVDVVVTEVTGAPSAATLEAVRAQLEPRREIAVDLQVLAPTVLYCALRIAVQAKTGSDAAQVRAAVEQAMRNCFTGRHLGKDVLRAQLGSLIYGVDGVENYNIISPASDMPAVAGRLVQLSSLTVEAM